MDLEVQNSIDEFESEERQIFGFILSLIIYWVCLFLIIGLITACGLLSMAGILTLIGLLYEYAI